METLARKLDRVSASLYGVNSRGLATMGAGINKLSNAMSNFANNTKTADFSRLGRNIKSLTTALSSVDTSTISKASSAMRQISKSLSGLAGVSKASIQVGELAKNISRLGYKSATNAINNIPKLATAMNSLMTTLSKAPKVSQNLIDMTNALANFARTGTSGGRAATYVSKSLNTYSKSARTARSSSTNLASAIGKVYASYWLLFRAFGKIGDAIDISSSLTEVQNVIDVTFGEYADKIEEISSTSIEDFGMSELTLKQIAGRYQAMGTAIGFTQGEMADMSVELTKLAADMASFYNVEQEAVATSLQAVFTGETEPLKLAA